MRRLAVSPLLLLVWVVIVNGYLATASSGGGGGGAMHLELIRKRGPPNETRLEHVMELVRHDQLRAEMIAGRVTGRRRRALAEGGTYAAAMPMSSAAYAGIGQYFVRVRVGTPAQAFLLVADTGSDLTWVKCRYRPCRRCRDPRGMFRAYQSSSFSPIRCSSQLCKNTLPFSLTKCPTTESPCLYDYRAVMTALRWSSSLRRYPRVEMKPFEFCFRWTRRGPGAFDAAAVPRLVVHLAGAGGGVVRLEPPVKSYVIDVAVGVKCVGLMSTPAPGVSIVGNILQQNHLWEFDIANKRLGFEPSSCSSLK